jgi:hypothetical protein
VIELEDIAYVRCGVARQTFWQTLPDGTMSTRPDLMTPSSCHIGYERKQRTPGALLSSDDFRVERRANGDASSVMTSAEGGGLVR